MSSNELLSQSQMELTASNFNVGELYEAQRKSWIALEAIRKSIEPGISEIQAVKLVAQKLLELGSTRSWHHPVFRIGENSAKPYHALPSDRVLKEDDIFYIDIGPTWIGTDGLEYEGDVGKGYTLKPNSEFEKCIANTEELFILACDHWRNKEVTGKDIYEWLSKEAILRGYNLVVEDDGHRIGDFPHKRVFSGGLPQADFKPSSGLWVLEVHLVDPERRFGAFFEDILK